MKVWAKTPLHVLLLRLEVLIVGIAPSWVMEEATLDGGMKIPETGLTTKFQWRSNTDWKGTSTVNQFTVITEALSPFLVLITPPNL